MSENKKNHSFRYIILTVIAVLLVWSLVELGSAAGPMLTQVRKISSVLNLIQSTYVEEPDLDKLTEGAIEGMLKRLDPHSIYIPPKEQSEFEERDIGEFSGIGISFMIHNELITVISPIPGSPADQLGIRAGDRIVEIEGESAFGITNDEVFKKLRGPSGSKVKVKILRDGVNEPIDFTIVRDKIPINSVWTYFMLDDSTGYIMLNQFMLTTDRELWEAMNDLESKGMTRLIFDLRNNQGGRLSQAVSVADMFVPGGYPLVSRESRDGKYDTTYTSTNMSTRDLNSLIVLINGGSASASEIVAGAVQDLDRGLIVGETSFGKGLVQVPFAIGDGAVIRISTAHWLTPIGRLVQRPYDKGRAEYYAVRYRNSEAAEDTTKRVPVYSKSGRPLYEGMGIEPDVTVEERTITGGTARLLNERVIFELAEQLRADHGLNKNTNFDNFRNNFRVSDSELKRLIPLAKEKEIEFTQELLDKDRDYLKDQVKAELAQLVWNSRDDYYKIRIEADPVVQEAMKQFPQAVEIVSVWQ